MTTLADFTLPLLDGTSQPLSAYQGKVVLLVNTASQCGHTPQYQGLEALWRDHPLYGWLKAGHPGDIEWNIAKFLVGRDGQVAARFAPDTQPADLAGAIAQQL